MGLSDIGVKYFRSIFQYSDNSNVVLLALKRGYSRAAVFTLHFHSTLKQMWRKLNSTRKHSSLVNNLAYLNI
jgi:hypothetical protein